MAEKGLPLPKFGEWDVNDPASAEGFTVIFNKARNEKRTGDKADSPPKDDSTFKHETTLGKPQSLIECFDRSRKRKGGFAVCNLLLQNPEGTKENYLSSLATGFFQKTGAAVKL